MRVMCGLEQETITHLFFNCQIVNQVWYDSYQWIEENGVNPNNVKMHMLQHDLIVFSKKKKK